MGAWLSNVINVESWDWSTKNDFSGQLALLKSDWPDSGFDKSRASSESTLKDDSGSFADELVLKGEDIVLWILNQWVNETVTDGHTFEVDLQLILVLESEVMGNGWDVMSSVRFSSNVEIFILELWEFLKEAYHESGHGLGDLLLVGVIIEY